MSEKIRIAVVDDHKIVRDGINAMLLAYDDIEMVAETSDAETMLKMIKGIRPVILILDLNLPGMDGNTLAKNIGEIYPDVKIIVLSSDVSEATILESVRIGVKAYLSKDASEEEFIKAIRTVDAGDEYYGERIAGIIFKSYLMKVAGKGTELVPESIISEREKEVIACFANGLSYKEVAAQLNISPRTVETHRNNIMEKLGLFSLADLIKYAIKNGIIKL